MTAQSTNQLSDADVSRQEEGEEEEDDGTDDVTEFGATDEDTMEMLSANLPQNMFRTPDPQLQRAWQETERTNQVSRGRGLV